MCCRSSTIGARVSTLTSDFNYDSADEWLLIISGKLSPTTTTTDRQPSCFFLIYFLTRREIANYSDVIVIAIVIVNRRPRSCTTL